MITFKVTYIFNSTQCTEIIIFILITSDFLGIFHKYNFYMDLKKINIIGDISNHFWVTEL